MILSLTQNKSSVSVNMNTVYLRSLTVNMNNVYPSSPTVHINTVYLLRSELLYIVAIEV